MKKPIACILGGLLLFSCGCTGLGTTVENGDVVFGVPDYTSAKGYVDIDSWIGPSMTDKAYQEYVDCGYNMVHYNNTSVHVEGGTDAASFEKLNLELDTHLSLAEKYDIKVILAMNSRNLNATSATPFEWVDQVMNPTLQKWKDKDTFYGYMSYDEPGFAHGLVSETPSRLQKDYDDIADYILDEYLYFSEKYPGKAFETVLLRDTNVGETSMRYMQNENINSYEDYLQHYYDKVMQYMPYDERIYSMDAYTFTNNRGEIKLRECFISSLEKTGYKAEKYNAEKWTYMMNHANIYNTASVLYQYYTAMAYGYTHFVTYIYNEAWGHTQFSIDVNGNRTDNYYYYQAAHKEVRTFENVYREFTDNWLGALVYDGTQSTVPELQKPWRTASYLLDGYHRIKKVKATQDTLIGVMKDKNGYEGFMVTNQANPTSNTRNSVEIEFAQADKALVFINGQDGQLMDLTDGVLALTLKSGGGAFVIPVKEA